MSLRETSKAAHPTFPWLAAGDVAAVQQLLHHLNWIDADERVTSADRAGEGNMNLTLRIITNRKRFILKQARPWVEKYDQIAAPWDRICYEHRFYKCVQDWPTTSRMTPAVIGFDADARVLTMTEIAGARDLTGLYAGESISNEAVEALANFASSLHQQSHGQPAADFANRDMRTLNCEHIFRFPLRPNNGLDLDTFEPGLSDAAADLMRDDAYLKKITAAEQRYLADGDCLLHGDYFPGSWLIGDAGLFVIDPEFCFYGDREFDVAVAVAHFALANQAGAGMRLINAYGRTALSLPLVAAYAGAEIMRRLIGVAQLPIAPTTDWRRDMLSLSRRVMMDESIDLLWTSA